MNEQSEFMKKWEAAKKRAAELATGTEVPEAVKEITIQPVEQVVKKEVKNYTVKKKYYNIHKRSLPVGIDKVVVYNIEYDDAVKLIESASDMWGKCRLFQEKIYYDEVNKSKTVIYYDIVPVNATPKEHSVFYNPDSVKGIKPVEQNMSEGETQWIS